MQVFQCSEGRERVYQSYRIEALKIFFYEHHIKLTLLLGINLLWWLNIQNKVKCDLTLSFGWAFLDWRPDGKRYLIASSTCSWLKVAGSWPMSLARNFFPFSYLALSSSSIFSTGYQSILRRRNTIGLVILQTKFNWRSNCSWFWFPTHQRRIW